MAFVLCLLEGRALLPCTECNIFRWQKISGNLKCSSFVDLREVGLQSSMMARFALLPDFFSHGQRKQCFMLGVWRSWPFVLRQTTTLYSRKNQNDPYYCVVCLAFVKGCIPNREPMLLITFIMRLQMSEDRFFMRTYTKYRTCDIWTSVRKLIFGPWMSRSSPFSSPARLL